MKKAKTPTSVIYVNFSQYDNTGRILDYLREQFDTVLQFSFDHLRLKHGRKTNLITLYTKGEKPYINTLYSLRVPPFLLFPSLPLVGVLMVIQTVRQSYLLRRHLSRPVFFTVNAYPALIGVLLKILGLANQVTYWVWDYYPVRGPDWTLRMIRYAYLVFDMIALRLADTLIFPNRRQMKLRQTLHGIRGSHRIIPLGGPKPTRYHQKVSHTFGFLGMLKSSQGLDLMLACFDKILTNNPNIVLEIVGSGPEEEKMRAKAARYAGHVKFYGFIEDQDAINRIVRRWFAGLAVYEPAAGNESYFGDPSKIKVYVSQGVPIITTNVTSYGAETKKHKLGKVIRYSEHALGEAIREVHKKQRQYRKSALQYAEKFYYRRLYRHLFN
jgi:glycosyltransferase involved in cell wall biosynthesis